MNEGSRMYGSGIERVTIGPASTRRLSTLALAMMFAAPVLAQGNEAARIREFEAALQPAVEVAGQPQQRWTLSERMAHWKVPGMSIAVIRNGRVAWAKGYGVLQAGSAEKMDTATVFSVASVSKVGAAAITLRLLDAGRLDLDRDVNGYLRRWQVPANAYTAIRPVTLRGILSHSAGLSVSGFPDFQPGEALPSVIDTLEGKVPAKHEPVRVVFVPGTRFQYSGGGITVEELVIEEVTGLGFNQAARQYLFQPLGMTRSTYENPLPENYGNVAKAHGEDGRPRALPRGYEAMPEMAASGLWTTPSDYAKLVIAITESYRGKAGSFLSAMTAHQMLTEVGRSPVGLGPFLEGEGLDRRFSHGGSNDSYKALMEGHPGTGNGVVIFTNAVNGSRLYAEVRRAVAAAEGWSAALGQHLLVPAVSLSAGELREKAAVYEVLPSSSIPGFRRRSSDALMVRVSESQGSLYLSEDEGGEPQRLIPIDAARFVGENDASGVEFVRGYSGLIESLILRGANGYFSEARKVTR